MKSWSWAIHLAESTGLSAGGDQCHYNIWLLLYSVFLVMGRLTPSLQVDDAANQRRRGTAQKIKSQSAGPSKLLSRRLRPWVESQPCHSSLWRGCAHKNCTHRREKSWSEQNQTISFCTAVGKIFRHTKENLQLFGQQTKSPTNSGSIKALAIGHSGHSGGYDVWLVKTPQDFPKLLRT